MPIRITIEKLVSGGYGLARSDGGVIFVSGVAPGETVLVEPVARKGGSIIARPQELLERSPRRRQPPCPLATICGGCDWLHLDYAAQLEAKQGIVLDCMTRIGKLKSLPEIEVVAADEFSYRHRAQFKTDRAGAIGFFARTTTKVVAVAACPLLVPRLNTLLADLTERPASPPFGTGEIMVMAGDNDSIASAPVIEGTTTDRVRVTVAGKKFDVRANGFFQSNQPLLDRLGTWARPHTGGEFLIDLYGGCGFFSIMLADRFNRGLLIESIAGQVHQASVNFALNGCAHLAAATGLAEQLSSFASGKNVDCLVADPPRPGLSDKVRASIASVGPARLLYVSCNPPTQARDLGFFVNQAGYTVEKAALFDLYPNTHHIETAVLLCRGRRS